ncbi:hypothetical protein D3C76_324510 [compost metagenome]
MKVIAANCQVDTTAGEVQWPACGHQVQLQVGMGGMEAGQARDQPAHGDGRLAGQHQHIVAGLLLQALHGAFELFEHGLGGALQGAAGGSEENGPVAALEQFDAKAFFEQAYLTADRAMGDVQALGGAHEAFGFGGDVEVAESVEGRQFHVVLSVRKTSG